MANTRERLEMRLQRADARVERIVEAGANPRPRRVPEERWWNHLVTLFNDENTLFERIGIDRGVFLDCLAFVRDVAWETRGRQSVVRTNREKLFFLMTFLARGIDVLEIIVAPFIRTRNHVLVPVKNIARVFAPILTAGMVRFFNEVDPDVPQPALVVDCTVCQIRKPALDFDDAKRYFSGKHHLYCLKKEVCVNIRSGTAALVAKSFPGSVPDITILRSHAGEVNAMLQGRSMLADLGYRGAEHDVPTIIVCDQDQAENRAKRVLVECFFGRLKRLWSVFSTTWVLSENEFDLFFDLACGFTNIDVLHRPLREVDRDFNDGVLNIILNEQEVDEERRRAANEAYVQRRRDRLGNREN